MTNQEVNLAINLDRGWKKSPIKTEECNQPALWNGEECWVNYYFIDYCNSANDMSRVIQTLDNEKCIGGYRDRITEVGVYEGHLWHEVEKVGRRKHILQASPVEQARAYLATKKELNK